MASPASIDSVWAFPLLEHESARKTRAVETAAVWKRWKTPSKEPEFLFMIFPLVPTPLGKLGATPQSVRRPAPAEFSTVPTAPTTATISTPDPAYFAPLPLTHPLFRIWWDATTLHSSLPTIPSRRACSTTLINTSSSEKGCS